MLNGKLLLPASFQSRRQRSENTYIRREVERIHNLEAQKSRQTDLYGFQAERERYQAFPVLAKVRHCIQ